MYNSYAKPLFDTSEILALNNAHNYLMHYKKNICKIDFNNYKNIKKKISSLHNNTLVSLPIKEILKKFKYVCIDKHSNEIVNNKTISTKDIDTSIGKLSFCGNNAAQVKYESRLLKMLLEKYFYLLYECKNEPKFNKDCGNGISAVDYISNKIKNESILYLNDFNDKLSNALSITLDKINDIKDHFDNGVIYFKNKPKHNRRYTIKQLFSFFNKINDYGEIFITNDSANIFPYGNKAYEILLKLSGFEIFETNQLGKGLFAKKLSS